jgi:hypothetical protein
MRWVTSLLLSAALLYAAFLYAAETMHFTVTDARGKETSAVSIEAGATDENGWQPLKIAKAKGEPVLVWPFDGLAKMPDGPEPVPATVIQRAEARALTNRRVLAFLITHIVLSTETLADVGQKVGFPADVLSKAFANLSQSSDPFEKGAWLLYAGKAAEAVEPLASALKQRQRQLTRVPSEIYPAALLYGQALFQANKFDDAAVAFLAAAKLRPADPFASRMRAESLVKAGKADAAGR